jgi:hypothetical protein
MTIVPSILRHYGLGADVSGRNPTITSSPDNKFLSLILSHNSNNGQTKVTVVEVKGLKNDNFY